MNESDQPKVTRRDVLVMGAASVVTPALTGRLAHGQGGISRWGSHQGSTEIPTTMQTKFLVNGVSRELELDPRTSLLDALREHLHLTGTKKGCDHGQCGACTVLVDGVRINACLSLAVMHEGDNITTIEGLGTPEKLHPMQAAFIKHDGYQCGYCTPGQICSAVAVLNEIKSGVPSHVTADLLTAPEASNVELRERMSGNICRCGAYSNIAEAIGEVTGSNA
ncbi:aldehyde dehydrogenase iron-sulfur subunit PaoA [Cupriavidus pinatubonensis]|uniref:aldehyde dehydrogenase iron-sulfur subunit PaoA n=1 Tax=Cupriavidus pinatubonensis TaxID=248026 RepID=UPI0011281017|nr:aldehyde dehydrogenase iron-sulfur subunit PaoA [Cupriavidus pinatubonensis]TPQ40953.1 aldehyde dehydrogenase iron-sulfur subunit [Cupriavidus pinatubonensis]